MTVLEAAFLGMVQGLTEFLPISSSAHLILAQSWLKITEPVLFFDTFLHIGTLIAVLAFFGQRLLKLKLHDYILLAVATLPAVIVGVLWKDQIEAAFQSDKLIGFELIITGCLNWLADRELNHQPWSVMTKIKKFLAELWSKLPAKLNGQQGNLAVSPINSLTIGVAQAVAIIPGISRSGTTLWSGLMLGLDRELAFNFAFLISVPAIIGAMTLQILDLLEQPWVEVSAGISTLALLVGGGAALITGLASLAMLKWMINKARLEWFAYYCWILGLIAIFLV